MPPDRTVGLIGLGLVGRAIAARLQAAGFEVLGYDVSPDAMRAFEGPATPAAMQAKRIVLAVFDTADVERAVGESNASLYIDCTTGDPERIEALAGSLAKRNVNFVEAPLAGSSEAIRRGEATMYVGGDGTGCEDILAAISSRRITLGPVGKASRAKLAINLVLGLNRAALAEGMAFAEAIGIDRRQFLELYRASPAASAASLAKGEKMVSGDFDPESRIRQHLKDVQHMRRYARTDLPLTAAHEKMLAGAIAAGDGELDNAAIILQYTRGQK
jgi:3-hydroxyisobutyrate dehydrogenase-like beta-hydroxyacid dehydrogenase